MTTVLPRIQITLTREVAEALEMAAQQWPTAPKSKIASQLIVLGSQQLADERDIKRLERRAVITATAGMLSDAYPDNYLEDLRKDWPA